MRRVRNRFVAEVLDADVDGPAPYIVTRYVPGRTLEDTVRQDGPLRGAALDCLAEGLAEALAAIHAAGVVHRDLKPGNVMLSGGQPVIIDFGIAHVPDSTRLTKTGLVMGTPGYLAPEVIEGAPSSGASDVHSWGATVAYAATGTPAVRHRQLPDDLLPRARGQGGDRRGTAAAAAVRHRRAVDRPEVTGRPRAGWPGSWYAAPPRAGPGAPRRPSPAPSPRRPALPPSRPSRLRRPGLRQPAQASPAAARLPGPRFPADPLAPTVPPGQFAAPGSSAAPSIAAPGSPSAETVRCAAIAAARSRRRPGPPTSRPRRRPATWPTCCRRSRPGGRSGAAAGASAGRARGRPAPAAGLAAARARPAQPGRRGRRGGAQRAAPRRGHGHVARGDHPAARGRPGAGRPHRAAQPARRPAKRHRDRDRDRPVDRRPRGADHGPARARSRSSSRCSPRRRRSSSPGRGTLPGAGSWAAGAAVAFYCVGPGLGRAPAAAAADERVGHPLPGRPGGRLHLRAGRSPWRSSPPRCRSRRLSGRPTSSTVPHLMPGLPSLGGLLHSLQKWLLGNTVGMLHLP